VETHALSSLSPHKKVQIALLMAVWPDLSHIFMFCIVQERRLEQKTLAEMASQMDTT
jgi:hypothetical protein